MAHPTPDDLALIALGEDVDDEALQHVAGCRACFAEIEALQQVVAVGRSLSPEDRLVAPPPQVWQAVVVQLEGGRATSPEAEVPRQPLAGASAPRGTGPGRPVEPAARRPERCRRRWGVVALAAAAALVVGLGGGFALKGLLGADTDGAGTIQLNALPQWPGASGTATVEKSADGGRTLVIAMDLPPTLAVEGTFEVWMSDSRASEMLPMGTMAGTTARLPIPATVDLRTHPVVDVSLEPDDDTDPDHSDTSVLRGRLNV